MFNIMLLITAAGALGYGAWRVVTYYRAAQGDWWQRLLATAKDSATILWQKIVAAGGLLMLAVSSAADVFNAPEVKQAIADHMSPGVAGTALLVIAVIGVWARLRTLGNSGGA